MKLTAKLTGELNPVLGVQNKLSEVEAVIMLGAFEHELDSLALLAEQEVSGTVAEAVIRRYQSAEELLTQIGDSYDRIRLKMYVLRERILGGISAGDLLESPGE